MPWSGEAAVHVSLVNWVKGSPPPGPYLLAIQKGDDKDGPWDEYRLPSIPSSLSPTVDVTGAVTLQANIASKSCYNGQTHGHEGFLLTPDERAALALGGTSRGRGDVSVSHRRGSDRRGSIRCRADM